MRIRLLLPLRLELHPKVAQISSRIPAAEGNRHQVNGFTVKARDTTITFTYKAEASAKAEETRGPVTKDTNE